MNLIVSISAILVVFIVKSKELLILNPKVSIIIPVYNAELFLSSTINSLMKQTLENIEIILVDDGSTDNSLTICYKYQKKDKRIKVIKKSNGGVSSARNEGIKSARGTYIGFVDADDWIEPEMYEQMYDRTDKINADIGMCNYAEDSKSKSTVKLLDTNKEVFEKKDVVDYLIPEMIAPNDLDSKEEEIMGSIWRLIINRKFIENNKLMFKEDLALMEDLVFCVEAFLKSNYIAFDKGVYYHYVITDDSALTAYRPNSIDETLHAQEYLETILKKESASNNYKKRMRNRYIKLFTSSIAKEPRNDNPKSTKEQINTIKKLCQDKKLKEYLKELDTKRYSMAKKVLLHAVRKERVYFLYLYYKTRIKLKK